MCSYLFSFTRVYRSLLTAFFTLYDFKSIDMVGALTRSTQTKFSEFEKT